MLRFSCLDCECACYFINLQVSCFSSTWELHPSLKGRLRATSCSPTSSYLSESIFWKLHSKNQFIFWLLTTKEKMALYILGRIVIFISIIVVSLEEMLPTSKRWKTNRLPRIHKGGTSACHRVSPAPLRQWLSGQVLQRSHARDNIGKMKIRGKVCLPQVKADKDCNCCTDYSVPSPATQSPIPSASCNTPWFCISKPWRAP